MSTDPQVSARTALLLNGTVGAGKTTTADAVGALLRERGVPHAVVDLDALRRSWPPPADDPFNGALLARNLRAVAANAWDVGAVRLVLAGVAETSADLTALASSVGVPLVSCRLTVRASELRRRLLGRHAPGPEREWHLTRTGTLAAVLEEAGVDDHVLAVAGEPPEVVALRVLRTIGWDV